MAKIYLIRHGQASFGKANYDQLSDIGHQQGELVGHALHQRGVECHHVIHGSMQRHIETMSAAQRFWHSYGPVSEHSGFNEYDSDHVIAKAFPQFSNKLAIGAWLITQKNKRKAFQEMFSQAVDRWISGNHDEDYKEPWPDFTGRCVEALHSAIKVANGKDIVVFTSGGPITAIAQHCLELGNAQAFKLNWTLLNGAITQLLYSRDGRLSLASCNEHHHLAGAGKQFLTYR